MNFLQSSLSFSTNDGSTHHHHLVPHKDSKFSLDHALFSQDDNNVIYAIREKGYFNVSSRPLIWQMKILIQVLTYIRKDIQMISYELDVEKLINLMSILQTCGFAIHQSLYVSKVESKCRPKDGKNTIKFYVKIERTAQFEKEFLREEIYHSKKLKLDNLKIDYQESCVEEIVQKSSVQETSALNDTLTDLGDDFYDMVETTSKSFQDLETTNFQSIKDENDEYGVECTDIIKINFKI
jgi:hypothetical protein